MKIQFCFFLLVKYVKCSTNPLNISSRIYELNKSYKLKKFISVLLSLEEHEILQWGPEERGKGR